MDHGHRGRGYGGYNINPGSFEAKFTELSQHSACVGCFMLIILIISFSV